jgi:hypothetical protein
MKSRTNLFVQDDEIIVLMQLPDDEGMYLVSAIQISAQIEDDLTFDRVIVKASWADSTAAMYSSMGS